MDEHMLAKICRFMQMVPNCAGGIGSESVLDGSAVVAGSIFQLVNAAVKFARNCTLRALNGSVAQERLYQHPELSYADHDQNTFCINANKATAKLLQHSNIMMTARYAHRQES